MKTNGLHHILHVDELDLHRWENEGGSLLGGAHHCRDEREHAVEPAEHRRASGLASASRLVDHGGNPRRTATAHWWPTAGRHRDKHRLTCRWSPHKRRLRRPRRALEKTPLGSFG